MGLDMYIRTDKQDELHYWRKHNALHNWFLHEAMKQELVENHNEFNMIGVSIDQDMLDRLVKDIKEGNLIPTEGFFFGSNNYDPREYEKDDLEACTKIQEAILKDEHPYYTSWW